MQYVKMLLDNTTMLELLAMVTTIVAVWFISKPKYVGQVLMFIAQILWLAHSLDKAQPGLILQSVILLLFSIRALISWRKNKIT